MDIKEIKEYLNTNKDNEDIKDLIKSLQTPITRESVEMWTKDGDGRSWLDRTCDIYSQKAIETARTKAIAKFKEEELPRLLDEQVKAKTNDGLTPDQIQLKELQDKFTQLEKEKVRMELTNKYSSVLNEKGLNSKLIDFVFDENEESFNNKLTTLQEIINTNVTTQVDNKIKQTSYTPPKDNNIEPLSGVEKAFMEMNPTINL